MLTFLNTREMHLLLNEVEQQLLQEHSFVCLFICFGGGSCLLFTLIVITLHQLNLLYI